MPIYYDTSKGGGSGENTACATSAQRPRWDVRLEPRATFSGLYTQNKNTGEAILRKAPALARMQKLKVYGLYYDARK